MMSFMTYYPNEEQNECGAGVGGDCWRESASPAVFAFVSVPLLAFSLSLPLRKNFKVALKSGDPLRTAPHTQTHTHTGPPKMTNKQSDSDVWAVTGRQLQMGLTAEVHSRLSWLHQPQWCTFMCMVLSKVLLSHTQTHSHINTFAYLKHTSKRKSIIVHVNSNLKFSHNRSEELMNKIFCYLTITNSRGQSSLQTTTSPKGEKKLG